MTDPRWEQADLTVKGPESSPQPRQPLQRRPQAHSPGRPPCPSRCAARRGWVAGVRRWGRTRP